MKFDEAREIYRRQDIGHRLGFGTRAALLIVDFVNGFNDPTIFGGGNIPQAIERTVELLAVVRQKGLPVVLTRIVYEEGGTNIGSFARKLPGLAKLVERAPISQIVPQLTPQTGDYVLRKTQPSAFFGTDLVAWLTWRRVDTLLVAGCTTSGCVRASVVDAASWNFRPIVVRECVGDRAITPHEASLFDIDQKYADVLSIKDAVAQVQRLVLS